jgi:SAM-dependent methyltransferase
VPDATFIQADMTTLAFPEASFGAVVSFFAIFHVPREQHGLLFRAIASWLRPSGVLVTTLLSRANPGLVEEWQGVPMFYSGFSGDAGTDVVRSSGLEIVSSRDDTVLEDGRPITFHWVVARKPIGAVRSCARSVTCD